MANVVVVVDIEDVVDYGVVANAVDYGVGEVNIV